MGGRYVRYRRGTCTGHPSQHDLCRPQEIWLTGSVAVTWMGGKDRGTLCSAEFAKIPLFFPFDVDCDCGGRPRRALGGTNAGRDGVGTVDPGGRGNGGMRLVEADDGFAEVDDSVVVMPRARRSHSRRAKVASPLDGQKVSDSRSAP
jgi:hypothetical protein